MVSAIDTCVRVVDEAKDMRFKENPKWYDLGGQFTNFVRDNKELLQQLSGALKVVSLVAGVLSFIPFLAPVMAPLALGAALAASVIDLSVYAATGEGDLTTLLVDVGLNVLPGVGRLARMGMARYGDDAARAARAGDGPVVFHPRADMTPDEVSQMQRYVDASNRALDNGYVSPTGRVSTKGELRDSANEAAAAERIRASQADNPYQGQAGHAPDTTWTGRPDAYEWHDQTARVNTSLGAQARNYPIGHVPTEFQLGPPKAR